MNNKTLKLTITALFMALVCAATMVVKIPITITGGYINLGDCVVLLSGVVLGPLYGGLAAGVGSALADFISGYVVYIPATFLVKYMMAVCVGLFVTDLSKKSMMKTAIFGVVAECFMVVGYFAYEAVFLGYGFAAAPAMLGNAIQGIINWILFMFLIPIFRSAGFPLFREHSGQQRNK